MIVIKLGGAAPPPQPPSFYIVILTSALLGMCHVGADALGFRAGAAAGNPTLHRWSRREPMNRRTPAALAAFTAALSEPRVATRLIGQRIRV